MQTDKNYFELFQLETAFNIDTAMLAKQYRQMQREFHPDRFSHKSSGEQLRASQFSAILNDAFQTLKKVVQRGKYLLTCLGYSIPDHHTIKDTAFLMMQLELREQLEDLVDAKNIDGLAAFAIEVKQLLDEKFCQIDQCFAAKDDELASQVLALIHQYQFIEKLHSEIEAEEEKLLDY
jgi:molecular chaperone HscB